MKKFTNETLKNTWGVVESKEHAEFIAKLAELHGFEACYQEEYKGWFSFDEDELYFFDTERLASSLDAKQITIPLPPKDDKQDSNEQKPNPTDLPKHFDCVCNKCGGKCCIGGCDKTWPQVGDPVTVFGQQGVIALPADDNGVYIVESNGRYFVPKLEDMTKPKSKEDLLIEELQVKLCENNYVDNYTLANDIVNGMIEGLVYTGGAK